MDISKTPRSRSFHKNVGLNLRARGALVSSRHSENEEGITVKNTNRALCSIYWYAEVHYDTNNIRQNVEAVAAETNADERR